MTAETPEIGQFELLVDVLDVDIDAEEATHAGIAVLALDTGRVLMIQRALEDGDENGGLWEFPGGTRDAGETTLDTAVREFGEEVGHSLVELPAEVLVSSLHASPDGRYHGFVGLVAVEEDLPLHEPRTIDNPDGDRFEAVAWWDVADAALNPALRPEVKGWPWEALIDLVSDREDKGTVPEETMTVTENATSKFKIEPSTMKFDGYALPGVTVTTAQEAAPGVDTLDADDAAWEGVLVVEGVPTGDRRAIAPGALTHRELPLPLMAMFRNADGGAGHAAAEIAGRIDEIVFEDLGDRRIVRGRGVLDLSSEAGQRAARLNKKGMLRGVSVDLDSIEAVFVDGRDEVLFGRIMGATLTPFPAFAEAHIRLMSALEAAVFEAAGCDCEPTEYPADDFFVALEAVDQAALTASSAALVPDARVWTPWDEPQSLVASGGAPVKPPAEWFELAADRPERPVRIHPDGRVDGYAALWGTCHIGFQGRCVEVPRAGARGYSDFLRGQVLTAEGTVVATGALIMGPEHVAREAHHSIPQVQDAYAAVGCRIADVVLYEDDTGLWVTGAAKPDITEADVRAFNAADGVSPHWQPVPGGGRELAVLLAVNYSGFQVANTALVASGQMQMTITDGKVGALVGHNPGFDKVRVLAAQVETLTAQVDLLLAERAQVVRAQRAVDALAALDTITAS